MPTLVNVWPCALLIVMAKAGLSGNCRRRNEKGKSSSPALTVMVRRGMQTSRPRTPSAPVMISAWMTLTDMWRTMSRVPLARPSARLILRRRMTTQTTFRLSACGGRPAGFRALRSSGEGQCEWSVRLEVKDPKKGSLNTYQVGRPRPPAPARPGH